MDDFASDSLIEKLNDLLQLHRGSLMRHLNEAQPYLDGRTYQVWQPLQKQLQDHRQQRSEQITDMLNRLCDSRPLPNVYEQEVAFCHFLNLDTLLPHLLENLTDIHQRIISLLPGGHSDIDSPLNELVQSVDSDIQSVEKVIETIAALPANQD